MIYESKYTSKIIHDVSRVNVENGGYAKDQSMENAFPQKFFLEIMDVTVSSSSLNHMKT